MSIEVQVLAADLTRVHRRRKSERFRSGGAEERDGPEPRAALRIMAHTECCCLVLPKHLPAITGAWRLSLRWVLAPTLCTSKVQ